MLDYTGERWGNKFFKLKYKKDKILDRIVVLETAKYIEESGQAGKNGRVGIEKRIKKTYSIRRKNWTKSKNRLKRRGVSPVYSMVEAKTHSPL
ncbi:MAG: hypothetical protein KAW12_10055 [Candidatus Aminicenantes bacterium]|nr:hypothetical protein [Candidatus Aminicenantes bacterium]